MQGETVIPVKAFKIIIIACSAILLSSCGATNYLSSNMNLNNTAVVLSQANFRVVGTVSSAVSSTNVFGIGGLSRRALRENAIAELTKKANLTGSQALVNVSVHTSSKTILFIGNTRFTAQGTIIEFIDGAPDGGRPMPGMPDTPRPRPEENWK